MSCAVCNGYPGCPTCSPEVPMIECPDCLGSGHIFYDIEGELITMEEWEKLPINNRFEETCDTCEGTGVLEFDYEPDYEDYS